MAKRKFAVSHCSITRTKSTCSQGCLSVTPAALTAQLDGRIAPILDLIRHRKLSAVMSRRWTGVVVDRRDPDRASASCWVTCRPWLQPERPFFVREPYNRRRAATQDLIFHSSAVGKGEVVSSILTGCTITTPCASYLFRPWARSRRPRYAPRVLAYDAVAEPKSRSRAGRPTLARRARCPPRVST